MNNPFKDFARSIVARKSRTLAHLGPVYYQGGSDVLFLGNEKPPAMLPPGLFEAVAGIDVKAEIKDAWIKRFTAVAGKFSPTGHADFISGSQEVVVRERVPIAPTTLLVGQHYRATFEMFEVNHYIAEGVLFVTMTADTVAATRMSEDYKDAARQAYNELIEAYGDSAGLNACFSAQMQAVTDWVEPFGEEPVKVHVPVDLNTGKTSEFYFAQFDFGKQILHVAPGGAAFTEDGERVVLADVIAGMPLGPVTMQAIIAYVCDTSHSFILQLREELAEYQQARA